MISSSCWTVEAALIVTELRGGVCSIELETQKELFITRTDVSALESADLILDAFDWLFGICAGR